MNTRNALINYRRRAVGDLCPQGFADLYGGFIPIFGVLVFRNFSLAGRVPVCSFGFSVRLPSVSPRVIRSRPARTYVLGPFERVWQTKRDAKNHWNRQRCCPQSFPRRIFRCTRFNEIIFPVTRSILLRARLSLRPAFAHERLRPSNGRPHNGRLPNLFRRRIRVGYKTDVFFPYFKSASSIRILPLF